MSFRALVLTALLMGPAFAALPTAQASAGFAWGSDLSLWSSYDDAQRKAALDVSVAMGMPVIATDAKSQGPVGWASTTYPTYDRYAANDGAVERVVRDAHARGLQVIGRFDAFEDEVAAAKYPWTVIGGSPRWVDPACAEIRSYVLAQVKELVTRVALDELAIDHVRYPDTGNAPGSSKLPCTGGTLATLGTRDRTEVVASFVREVADAARAIRPGIRVSVTVYASTMIVPFPEIGQDATKLAPLVDVLRPMAYPTYLYPGGDQEPYKAVYDHVRPGVVKYGAAKVQPWIQGIDIFATRSDLVCEEMRAVADAGASGALVWWFWSTGTSSAFWQPVAACVPGGAAPAPAPVGATFDATFEKRNGHRWWVEADVTSTGTVASVAARVNGGSPITLARLDADTWGGSLRLPYGASVVFVAKLTTGETVTSAPFARP